tara:strand:- start:138 stop:638 length:501 start_codon:yes stop_codon:yes gene_type:complete
MMKKLIIFDRDNTLIEDKGHTHKIENLKFLPQTIKTLSYVSKKKYLIAVITNQGGVAKGLYNISQVHRFHKKIKTILKKKNINLIFFFCPHHPKGEVPKYSIKCKCRKPGDLLIKKALLKTSTAKKNCIMFGDKFTDKQAALKAKIRFYYRQKKFFSQVKKIIDKG